MTKKAFVKNDKFSINNSWVLYFQLENHKQYQDEEKNMYEDNSSDGSR